MVVVPVKPPALGKSRLVGLTDEQRRELAEAFALDTVAGGRATRGVEAVLVVTDDFRLAAAVRGRSACEVMPDGVSEDLNATLVQAAAEVVRRWPGAVPVALCADLPGLRPDELADVLAEARRAGVGRPRRLRARPRRGRARRCTPLRRPVRAGLRRRAPRHAHERAGAVEVGAAATSVRTDVDDLADLGAALVAGVGPHTSRASGRRATPLG